MFGFEAGDFLLDAAEVAYAEQFAQLAQVRQGFSRLRWIGDGGRGRCGVVSRQ